MDKLNSSTHYPHIVHLINQFIENAALVRISVVKNKGVRFNMPCRILNFDSEKNNLSLYHVDEKQVYLINLNEIDDITF